jgi:hypothetical protein
MLELIVAYVLGLLTAPVLLFIGLSQVKAPLNAPWKRPNA